MFSNEIDFLVRQEQRQDRLRQAEHRRLVRAFTGQRETGRFLPRRAAGWLGGQLVRLGARLEHYGTASPAAVAGTRLSRQIR